MISQPPRILVVEDELLVAMDLEATLRDQDWEVLGPVSDVPKAMAVLDDERPDAVCLDTNLNGRPSVGIAAVLKDRGIPFVVVTGYNKRNVSDPAFDGAPIVHKPFRMDELVDALEMVMQKRVQ